MLEERRKRHYCRAPAVMADATKEMYWKHSLRCSGYGGK